MDVGYDLGLGVASLLRTRGMNGVGKPLGLLLLAASLVDGWGRRSDLSEIRQFARGRMRREQHSEPGKRYPCEEKRGDERTGVPQGAGGGDCGAPSPDGIASPASREGRRCPSGAGSERR